MEEKYLKSALYNYLSISSSISYKKGISHFFEFCFALRLFSNFPNRFLISLISSCISNIDTSKGVNPRFVRIRWLRYIPKNIAPTMAKVVIDTSILMKPIKLSRISVTSNIPERKPINNMAIMINIITKIIKIVGIRYFIFTLLSTGLIILIASLFSYKGFAQFIYFKLLMLLKMFFR